MDAAAREFLFELLRTPSPTGFENAGQKVWAGYVRPFADEVEIDTYGSVRATREGTGRTTAMLEAHADEIGFMVRYISDDGFIYVNRIGGSDAATARGKRVAILGGNGAVPGVIGITAIHIRDRKDEKVPEEHELFVDVGASSRDDVSEMGIRVGHPLVYAESVESIGKGRLCGRALDNRIGGFIVAQALRRLAEGDAIAARVHAVNAVQEEIGGHGAWMMAHRLMPDVALVVDVTHATDTPGISKMKHGEVKLGGGPSVTHGAASHPAVVQRLMDVAAAEEITVQHEATSRFTGTDTDAIFRVRSGIPSALVSLPMRYMHSTVEVVDEEDVEQVIRLMTGFVRSIRDDDQFAATL